MGDYVPGAISGLFGDVAVAAKSSKKHKSAAGEANDSLFSKPVAASIPTAAAVPVIKPGANSKSAAHYNVNNNNNKKRKEEEEKKPRNNPEQDLRTLFVGNIPIKRAASAASSSSSDESKAGGEEKIDGADLPDALVKSEDAAQPVLKNKADGSGSSSNNSKLLTKLEKRLRARFAQFGQVDSVRFRGLGITKVKVEAGSDFTKMRRVAAIKSSLDERVDSCIGFVVFKDAAAVGKALEAGGKSGLEFEGNHLRLDRIRTAAAAGAPAAPAKKEKEEGDDDEDDDDEAAAAAESTTSSAGAMSVGGMVFERKKTVFVGNVMFECSDEELRRHFDEKLGGADDDDEGGKPCVSVRIIRDSTTNLGKGFGYVLLRDAALVKKAVDECDGTMIRTRAIRVTKCERSSQKKEEKNAKKRELEELAEAQAMPKSGAEKRMAKKVKLAEEKAKKLKRKQEKDKARKEEAGAAGAAPKAKAPYKKKDDKKTPYKKKTDDKKKPSTSSAGRSKDGDKKKRPAAAGGASSSSKKARVA